MVQLWIKVLNNEIQINLVMFRFLLKRQTSDNINIDATITSLRPFMQAIWEDIWKHTVEKSHTPAQHPVPASYPMPPFHIVPIRSWGFSFTQYTMLAWCGSNLFVPQVWSTFVFTLQKFIFPLKSGLQEDLNIRSSCNLQYMLLGGKLFVWK